MVAMRFSVVMKTITEIGFFFLTDAVNISHVSENTTGFYGNKKYFTISIAILILFQ